MPYLTRATLRGCGRVFFVRRRLRDSRPMVCERRWQVLIFERRGLHIFLGLRRYPLRASRLFEVVVVTNIMLFLELALPHLSTCGITYTPTLKAAFLRFRTHRLLLSPFCYHATGLRRFVRTEVGMFQLRGVKCACMSSQRFIGLHNLERCRQELGLQPTHPHPGGAPPTPLHPMVQCQDTDAPT